ncbi:ABC transporter permease [Pseudorhodoplanes sp.]|uniref:ABC transporter permease n=1 Tax=Pseudorhodoplanes sp. TaxID=1934341 RepID=UPI003D0EC229
MGLLVLVLLVFPMIYMARLSASEFVQGRVGAHGFTLEQYGKVLIDLYYYRIVLRTAGMSLLVSVLSLILAFPISFHLARRASRMRGMLIFLIILPIMVGVVVRSYGWIVLLASEGPINQALIALRVIEAPIELMNTWTAVIIALTEIMLPFMILPLTSAIERINPAVEEAARTLGASPFRVFKEVTMPLAMPGVVSGLILVFSLTITSYATPALLGGPSATVIASLIVEQMLTAFNWPLGSALALLLVAITAVATGGGLLLSRTRRAERHS